MDTTITGRLEYRDLSTLRRTTLHPERRWRLSVVLILDEDQEAAATLVAALRKGAAVSLTVCDEDASAPVAHARPVFGEG